MWRRGAGRTLLLLAVAFIAEGATRKLPPGLWFAAVFVLVFAIDNIGRLRSGAVRPLFLEDILLGLTLYAGFGYLSSLLDGALFAYTGRHASPAVPAVVLAVLDKAYSPGNHSSRRG
ncbi:MAG TPA: hypothetical protein GX500_07810 [Firmicutes bacterium]|nr:hypothetical protein [Candidatus Fermentithermobacillaceae bacterium]